MGYYSDLFFRPKQAVRYSNEHPSAIRSFVFVLLGTFASLLSMLFLVGDFFPELLFSSFVGDVLRLVLGGFILLVIGVVFKKTSVSVDSFLKVISMLSHLSVYGFVIFLLAGLIMPALLIPDVLQAGQMLENGVIGLDEFNLVAESALSGIDSFSLLIGIILALVALVFGLLSLYTLYLAVYTFLNFTVFKTILVMVAYAIILGSAAGLFLG